MTVSNQQTKPHWLQLLPALLWPLFAFTVLFALWTPLRQIGAKIPDIIDKSHAINIAGVSFEIDRAYGIYAPTSQVADALKKLTADDIRLMLSISEIPVFYPKDRLDPARERYAPLIQIKLITEQESHTSSDAGASFSLTPLGIETRAYLIDVVVVALTKSADATPSAKR